MDFKRRLAEARRRQAGGGGGGGARAAAKREVREETMVCYLFGANMQLRYYLVVCVCVVFAQREIILR